MINIQDIIPFLKDGWIAQDRNGDIYWHEKEPYIEGNMWFSKGRAESFKDFGCLKEVENWADDWTQSLIQVKGVKTR